MLVLSLMMMAGRLTGFLRELLLARTFGAGVEADLAIVLLTLPDIFTGLLLAGGLNAALVPAFKQFEAQAAARLFVQIITAITLIFSAFALLIFLWPWIVVSLVAPGLAPLYGASRSVIWLCVGLAIAATAATGVTSAMLNAQSRFGVVGAGTLIFNTTVMIGLIFSTSKVVGVEIFAFFVLVACLIRLSSQLVGVRAIPLASAFSENLISRNLILAFFGAFSATSLVVLVPVVVRSMGSMMGPGSLATINYATKLIELPLGIVITTISIVALPALADCYARNDLAAMGRRFRTGVWRGFLFAVAIGLPMAAFSVEIVAGVFGMSGLSAEVIGQIARILQVLTLTLPLIAISSMQGVLLNASARSRQFFVAIAAAFGCFVLFLAMAFAGKSFSMVVFSMVVFHLSACVFLRIVSGEPIFMLQRAKAILLFQVAGVSLIAIAITNFALRLSEGGGFLRSAVLAGCAVSISFFFSLWAMNRVKESI